MKILVLLFYYNRPQLVLNALESLRDTTYSDWTCAFIDDGSDHEGKSIVTEYFKDSPELLEKFKFYNTGDTKAAKQARGGSIFGKFANDAIQESDADIGVMLCDDDALFPTYLEGLSIFFMAFPHIQYAYSHVISWMPTAETFAAVKTRTIADCAQLNLTGPINPWSRVDSSQVAWRLSCNKEGGCWFPHPQTSALDAALYAQLFNKYGACDFTGLIAQFKGWGPQQLGAHGGYDRVD